MQWRVWSRLLPVYDGTDYSPPAPVASVRVENPANGKFADGVMLLIDSGADVTLLPRFAVASIVPDLAALPAYELMGFDGNVSKSQAAMLALRFLNKTFRRQFLLTDEPQGILGRNILNCIAVSLNGPRLMWEEVANS